MALTEVQRKRFDAALKLAGLNQESFASQIGCSKQHLNYVINGHRPSKRLLAQVEAFTAAHLPLEVGVQE